MYSRRVSDADLEATSREQGWPLERHTRAQIDHAIAHFDELWDAEAKRLTRTLTPEEKQFITNERKVCTLDATYWFENYCYIINYHREVERFRPNVAQRIILALWAEREEQGLAIWMQQLKARRLGVSTLSELNVGHRFQFHSHSNCIIASADPGKSREMAGMIDFNLNQQPWWLLPQGKTKVEQRMIVEFDDIGTKLTIQAGNQFTGVARGSTPNVIHLSELMEWQDAEELIDGALMRAVIDTPNVFGILESTGGGMGSWWHRTWKQNKQDFGRGRARVIPVFLPWYVGTDLYPSEADLRARPVPADWQPSDRSIQHAERAREYVTTNPLLFKHLAKGNRDWRLSREQMWFREIEYETAKEKKQLNIFHMELCADDFEAFQSPNRPVIDPEILLGYSERTRNPIGVYTVIGPDIHPDLVAPVRIRDTSKPPLTISTRDVLPRHDVKYQLVPLTWTGYSSEDEGMKLLIWEMPAPGHTYGVGVDCSEGLGLDSSCIEVLREATPTDPPAQVAEWNSNLVTAFELWPVALAIGAMYSTHNPFAGRVTQCRLAIETQTNGASVQNELQKRGWTNFHPWKYNDKRQPTPDARVGRLGILTNYWFRSSMLDMLLTCLKEEAIDLPSYYLVQELITLEREAGEKKAAAAADCHDDRVMAIGFPLFSLHMNKPPQAQHARKKVAYLPGLASDPRPPHPIWTPPAQAMAQPFAEHHHQVRRPLRGRLAELAPIRNRQMPKGWQ